MTQINLRCLPHIAGISWTDFCSNYPAFSIALDGFVTEGPKYDWSGPRINLNHHENVDRMSTLATCGQVLRCLRTGMFEPFEVDGALSVNLCVNDCDEDVCTSVFILQEHELCLPVINPMINKLVEVESILDATAGMYPFPKDSRLLRQLNWVYDPYRRFRVSQEFNDRNPADFQSVIESVCHRIKRFAVGDGLELPLDTRYKQTGGGPGWAMVREIGPNARLGMVADGIRAFIAVREAVPGWIYTVGRMSDGIRFDVPGILQALNAAEYLKNSETGTWGGSTTIGGSPRVNGSQLEPETVEKIVNTVLGLDGRINRYAKTS